MDGYTRDRIEWALTCKKPVPLSNQEWRESPKDFKAQVRECCKFTYWSPNRPLAFSGLIGPNEGFTVGRFAFTFDLIPLDRMVSLELIPIGCETIGSVALEYCHAVYGVDSSYLLYKDNGSWVWSAKMITPSTYAQYRNQWQVTHVDEYGPSGHYVEPNLVVALGTEILAGYRPVARDTLDGIEFTPLKASVE